MKEVEVKMQTAATFDVYIGNDELIFKSGKAKASVAENKNHNLQWFVVGDPGTGYTIEIAKPPESVFKREKVLGKSGRSQGVRKFRVN